MGDDRKNQMNPIEACLSIALIVGGLLIARMAYQAVAEARYFQGIEDSGFALIVFAGAIDPINFLWLRLPFTIKEIKIPARFSVGAAIFGGIGALSVFIGWLCKHYWP